MKKKSLLALLTWVLAAGAFGQTQLSRWTIGDNNTSFDMTCNLLLKLTPSVQF
jgi:hypothetical protein